MTYSGPIMLGIETALNVQNMLLTQQSLKILWFELSRACLESRLLPVSHK